MPTPVRRYPPLETIQRETGRRLIRQHQRQLQRQSSSCTGADFRPTAGVHTTTTGTSSSSRGQCPPGLTTSVPADSGDQQSTSSEYDAEALLDEMADDLDCDPARKCQSCCFLSVVMVLVVFTLSLAKTYISQHVANEQHELTGVVFLVLLLFFVCLMLFFVRFSMILLRKRARFRGGSDGGGITASDNDSCQTDGEDCRTTNSLSSGGRRANRRCSAPPPYHEALLFPTPPVEGPPPTYDKINA